VTASGLLVFATVYVVAVAIPGPVIAATVSRSLSVGTQGAPAFVMGMVAGDLIWFTAVATGLSALAHRAFAVFVLLKYLGAAYLLYLAYRMWTSSSLVQQHGASDEDVSSPRLFLGSLVLVLSNPKAMIFFLALLPTVIDLPSLTLADGLTIAGAIAVLMPAVLGTYILAAARARELLRNPVAVRRMNRVSAMVMTGAAAAVVRS
jgi:threonine/homoserine/homoserine lactone efflux protein